MKERVGDGELEWRGEVDEGVVVGEEVEEGARLEAERAEGRS